MILRSLASGSSGNCLAVLGRKKLLIDAGISAARIGQELREAGISPEELDLILITHEHTDHIAGLAAFLRRSPRPVFLTAGTLRALRTRPGFSSFPDGLFRVLTPGEAYTEDGLEILPCPVPHDAAEPVAFRITEDGCSLGIVTDLGLFDAALSERMRGLSALYLEANHDRRMLEAGPYPYPLKLRVAGEGGHLSNEAAGAFLSAVWHPGLTAVMLGHLSLENNYPPLAMETVRGLLREAYGPEALQTTRLVIAPRSELSDELPVG